MIKKNKNFGKQKVGKKASKFLGKITLWKEIGETPLEVLENFKEENPKYKNEKFAYAGRLDPMAEGKLLVLVGDTCKEREKYLNLDKEYEFEILLGFKSDTKDLLGMAERNDWHTT
jgi:tRNA U55 pseudouridine synthase TruB